MNRSAKKRNGRLLTVICLGFVSALVILVAQSREANIQRLVAEADSINHLANENQPTVFETEQLLTSPSIDRGVIAGGGGTSSNGSIQIEGTIGEVGASGRMQGGPFTLSGGHWSTLIAAAGDPTPTPSPTPTPTPFPSPAVPTIFVEAETNQIAALDSVSFTRGPFTLTNDHNFSSDHRTRIIFFTTSLGFTQISAPDVATLSVEIGGFSFAVEAVGPSSFAGLEVSFIVFRLPDVPPGDWPLSIKVLGVSSTNSPTLGIRLGP